MCPPVIAAIGSVISYIGGAVVTAGTAVAAAGTAGTISGAVLAAVGTTVAAIGTGIGFVGGAITAIGTYAGAALGMEGATAAAASKTTAFLAGTFGENAATLSLNSAALTGTGTGTGVSLSTVAAETGMSITETAQISVTEQLAAGAAKAAGPEAVKHSIVLGKIGKAFEVAQGVAAVYGMFAPEEDPMQKLRFDPITQYNTDMSRKEYLDTFLSPQGVRPNWADKLYDRAGGDLTQRMGNVEDMEERARTLSRTPITKSEVGTGLQIKGKEEARP